jgi:hypothetical protein
VTLLDIVPAAGAAAAVVAVVFDRLARPAWAIAAVCDAAWLALGASPLAGGPALAAVVAFWILDRREAGSASVSLMTSRRIALVLALVFASAYAVTRLMGAEASTSPAAPGLTVGGLLALLAALAWPRPLNRAPAAPLLVVCICAWTAATGGDQPGPAIVAALALPLLAAPLRPRGSS